MVDVISGLTLLTRNVAEINRPEKLEYKSFGFF